MMLKLVVITYTGYFKPAIILQDPDDFSGWIAFQLATYDTIPIVSYIDVCVNKKLAPITRRRRSNHFSG